MAMRRPTVLAGYYGEQKVNGRLRPASAAPVQTVLTIPTGDQEMSYQRTAKSIATGIMLIALSAPALAHGAAQLPVVGKKCGAVAEHGYVHIQPLILMERARLTAKAHATPPAPRAAPYLIDVKSRQLTERP